MATIKQKCPQRCCPCSENCLCDAIGFHVGPALYPFAHPSAFRPIPDNQASVCCKSYVPSFWWNDPPDFELVGSESLVYEVWAETPRDSASEKCEDGDGTPEYLPTECTLDHLVVLVGSPLQFWQAGDPANPLTHSPSEIVATRTQWFGSGEWRECCHRWPNFFLKVIARSGLGDRVLAICNATWSSFNYSYLTELNSLCVPDQDPLLSPPCKCGFVQEEPACPASPPTGTVTVSIVLNGSVQDVAMTQISDAFSCATYSGFTGFCLRNHRVLLSQDMETFTWSISIFQFEMTYEPDFEISWSGEGGSCESPDGSYVGGPPSVGTDCPDAPVESFEVSVTVT